VTVAFSEKNQQALAAILKKAGEGAPEFHWLHKLVMKAGYAKVTGRDGENLLLVTARVLGRGFGVTERTVRNCIKEGMPVFQESHGNRPALYDVFDVVRWRGEREKERLDLADGDPLMIGNDGKDKWLREYRREKTREARRKNEIAEGLLVDTGVITTQLLQMAYTFRSRAEAIERDHGSEVGASVRDMIDEAQSSCERIFPQLADRRRSPAPVPEPARETIKPAEPEKKRIKKVVKPGEKPAKKTAAKQRKKRKPARKTTRATSKKPAKPEATEPEQVQSPPSAQPAPQPVENKERRAERRPAQRQRGVIRTRY